MPLRHAQHAPGKLPDYRASGGQISGCSSPYFRLPACDSLRGEKPNRCTLPPSLLAMQLHACFQIQTLISFLLLISICHSDENRNPVGAIQKRRVRGTRPTQTHSISTATQADAHSLATSMTMKYDATGNLIEQTDAEGQITTFTYDNRGNLLTRKDASGKLWQYEYDAADHLIKVTDPLNQTLQYVYDAAGNKVKEIDTNGSARTFEYNTKNQVIRVTDAKGNATAFVYDEDHRLKKQMDADGKSVSYEYDTDGRLTKTTDGNGNVITNVYDVAGGSSCSSCSSIGTGQPSQTIYPTFTRKYTYDTRGRKIAEEDLLTELPSAYVSYVYDAAGNLTAGTDKEGKTTRYTYDALRRLTQVTDPQTGVTAYTYDNRDNLIALADAKGQTTTFVYDKNNRLIKETRPMGQATNYQYNATGQLLTKTDAKGADRGRTSKYQNKKKD